MHTSYMSQMPKTLFEKLWDLHEINKLNADESLIYIDRIFLHERTGSIALKSLEHEQRTVKSPSRVFCTMDHIVDTVPGRTDETMMPSGKDFIVATRNSVEHAGIRLFDIGDPLQGIAHVISPELGIALPGLTIVCPDSHTCTLGGLGALGWGIGSTEAEHAMVTNTLRVKKPKTMRVNYSGTLASNVTAKDMILYLISQYGANAGLGYAVEFAGEAISRLSIEARMTLCTLAVEFSAFTGLVAPDEKTTDYCSGRTFSPAAENSEEALAHWRSFYSDSDATFDKEIHIDCNTMKPIVTWGTSPQHAVAIDGVVPETLSPLDKKTQQNQSNARERALNYMDLQPGTSMNDIKLDAAFIGSCTNSRLSDLRAAADYLKGKHIAPWISAVCVPGSTQVKKAAEAEGLDKIFTEAGFSWRESGCSMCFYAGGETFGAKKRVISTTNRNFEGRQGPGTRTHLASPLTVAASACKGYITAAEDN